MGTLLNTRRSLIAVVTVIAVLAVVVPTCRMVGCSMSVGSTMPWGHQPTVGLFGDCGGTYVVNATPDAVVPAGTDSLTVSLLAVLLAAVGLAAPKSRINPLRASGLQPPPPPEDPLGMRLTI